MARFKFIPLGSLVGGKRYRKTCLILLIDRDHHPSSTDDINETHAGTCILKHASVFGGLRIIKTDKRKQVPGARFYKAKRCIHTS
jgi:hypothetical protein